MAAPGESLLAGLARTLQGSLRLVQDAQAGTAPAPGGTAAALAATGGVLAELGQWLQEHAASVPGGASSGPAVGGPEAAPGGGSRLGTSKLIHSPQQDYGLQDYGLDSLLLTSCPFWRVFVVRARVCADNGAVDTIFSPGDALGAWLRAFRNLQVDSCAKSACSQLQGRFLAFRGQLGLVSSCVDVCQRLSVCVIACRNVSHGLPTTHGLRVSADCRLETDCRITGYSKRGNYSERSSRRACGGAGWWACGGACGRAGWWACGGARWRRGGASRAQSAGDAQRAVQCCGLVAGG